MASKASEKMIEVRETIKAFPIVAVAGLPVWTTPFQRVAAEAVVAAFAIDLKNGMDIFPEDEAAR